MKRWCRWCGCCSGCQRDSEIAPTEFDKDWAKREPYYRPLKDESAQVGEEVASIQSIQSIQSTQSTQSTASVESVEASKTTLQATQTIEAVEAVETTQIIQPLNLDQNIGAIELIETIQNLVTNYEKTLDEVAGRRQNEQKINVFDSYFEVITGLSTHCVTPKSIMYYMHPLGFNVIDPELHQETRPHERTNSTIAQEFATILSDLKVVFVRQINGDIVETDIDNSLVYLWHPDLFVEDAWTWLTELSDDPEAQFIVTCRNKYACMKCQRPKPLEWIDLTEFVRDL